MTSEQEENKKNLEWFFSQEIPFLTEYIKDRLYTSLVCLFYPGFSESLTPKDLGIVVISVTGKIVDRFKSNYEMLRYFDRMSREEALMKTNEEIEEIYRMINERNFSKHPLYKEILVELESRKRIH
jgi:hypothetical protein